MNDFYFIEDLDFENKRVLIRVDYNVPIRDSKVIDSTRIIESLSTIKSIKSKAKKIILMTHLGRPKGFDPNFKLDIVAKELQKILQDQKIDLKVLKLDDCIGSLVKKKIDESKDDEVILLENLRFYEQEKQNDDVFAKELSKFADIYINDAFGTAHRAHASTHGVTKFVTEVCAGNLLKKEILGLNKVINNPQKPFVSIVGCAKIKDKLGAIESLLQKSDEVLFGGAIVFSFLKQKGYEIGKSFYEDNSDIIKDLMTKYSDKIILPKDFIVTDNVESKNMIKEVEFDKIPKDMIGVDVGSKTTKYFIDELIKAKTILWNGPLGIFEIEEFAKSTNAVAEYISNSNSFSVIGGGDTVAAIKEFSKNSFSHISTGGGAFLEFIEGKILPGLEVLLKK